MSNPNYEEFNEIFPEFNHIGSTRRRFLYDSAENNVSEKAFGGVYTEAVYYLAAHKMTCLGTEQAGEGNVQSEKAGDLSRTYSNVSGEEDLSSTKYGLEFLRLRKSKVVGAMALDCETEVEE